MKDRVSQSPGRVLITPEDGGAPFYAVMARADQPVEPGTALNKANLLSDSTATALGLSGDPTVNDAFARLNGKVNSVETRATPVQYGGTGMRSIAGNKVLISNSAGTALIGATSNGNEALLHQSGPLAAPSFMDKNSLFTSAVSTSSISANATTVDVSAPQIKSNNFVWLAPKCTSTAEYAAATALNLYFIQQYNGYIKLGIANPPSSAVTVSFQIVAW